MTIVSRSRIGKIITKQKKSNLKVSETIAQQKNAEIMESLQITEQNRKKQMFFYIILSSIILFIAMNIYNYCSINSGYNKALEAGTVTFLPADLKSIGYEIIDNQYINRVGDAHLALPSVNRFVNTVKIKFASCPKQTLGVAIYYSNSEHGYSEKYVKVGNVSTANSELLIPINDNVTKLRVDIGSNKEEKFNLSSITINDLNIYNQKNLDLFQHNMITLIFLFMLLLIYSIMVCDYRIEKVYLIAATAIGLFYLISITPFSVPDEGYHYRTSFQLSNIIMLHWKDNALADATYFNYVHFSGHHNVSSAYIRVLREFFLPFNNSKTVTIPMTRNLNYFGYYLPQALGIAFARIFRLNVILTFYLGRMFNLAFYIICTYFAIKKTPWFKTVFFLLSVTPMAMQQAASYSYDAFINGLAFLLIAYFINAIYGEDKLKKEDFTVIIFCSVLLAPAKVVYYPILFLVLLVPMEKFKSKKQRRVIIFFVLGVSLLTIIPFNLVSLGKHFAGASGTLNWEGQHNYSVHFIFKHPLETVAIFGRTLVHNGLEYFRESFGLRLSGLTLSLPSYVIWLFVIFVILAIFSNNNHQSNQNTNVYITRKQKIFYCIISSIIILLTLLAAFLGWTSNTRSIILGVQGRYFIPILPLLCLAISNNKPIIKYDINNILVTGCSILQCVSIFHIIGYTIAH